MNRTRSSACLASTENPRRCRSRRANELPVRCRLNQLPPHPSPASLPCPCRRLRFSLGEIGLSTEDAVRHTSAICLDFAVGRRRTDSPSLSRAEVKYLYRVCRRLGGSGRALFWEQKVPSLRKIIHSGLCLESFCFFSRQAPSFRRFLWLPFYFIF